MAFLVPRVKGMAVRGAYWVANSVFCPDVLRNVLVVCLGKLEYGEVVVACAVKTNRNYTNGCVWKRYSLVHPS